MIKIGEKWAKKQFLPPETLKSANNDVTKLSFFMVSIMFNIFHFFWNLRAFMSFSMGSNGQNR